MDFNAPFLSINQVELLELLKIMKRTESKVVIVTGGALGTGRETCLLLLNVTYYRDYVTVCKTRRYNFN